MQAGVQMQEMKTLQIGIQLQYGPAHFWFLQSRSLILFHHSTDSTQIIMKSVIAAISAHKSQIRSLITELCRISLATI
jgi:hypothetical protein